MNKSRNGGFTLVELLVTITVGVIVTFAATTVLLLCLRVHNQSSATATRQNEIRIGLTVMENLLAENTITNVAPNQIKNGDGENDVLLIYSAETGTISTGAGATVLSNVDACVFTCNGTLVTCNLTVAEVPYSISVYCRVTTQSPEEQSLSVWSAPAYGAASNRASAEPDVDTVIAEALSDGDTPWQIRRFLTALTSQLGSTGRIQTESGEGEYYSQWYIGSYADHPGWSEATPWCACYVSWALEETAGCLAGTTPRFANVDSFCAEFVTTDNWKTDAPAPGDVIFFDWIVDDAYNPQHVGVVLAVRDGWVYTIEGNSNGRVAVCKYAPDDPQILGYGILNWT